MKTNIGFLLTGLIAASAPCAATPGALGIRFDAPATHFTQSCPVGNGRLGAMLFGGVDEERVVLNEYGMWSGSRQDADRPNAAASLPEIRRLLLAGKNTEAEKLVSENFTCAGVGSHFGTGATSPFGCYQMLANLRLKFDYGGVKDVAKDYNRELDLGDAVARLSFTRGGVDYTREIFASAPDEAVVLRLTASRPGALNFTLALDRPEKAATVTAGTDGLRLSGQLENGVDGKGVKFAAQVRVLAPGAAVSTVNGTLSVRGGSEALMLVTAATDIRTFAGRRADDPAALAERDLAAASRKPFAELRKAHVADYRRYFNRVKLTLGGGAGAPPSGPTAARTAALKAGANDPELMALYFNFGRYLLISCSRPGGLPANLQGIWADGIQTPWNCDWHLNVNVQMNYWPAEATNLSDLSEPLFALVDSLQGPGSATARKYYGARGWVAHVITNPWGFTAPGEGADWGATTTGSAWLCQHLWDHYLFTGDRAFLARAYPILKGSALFYSDMLIEEPAHHWRVTAPSNSPENSFVAPDGKVAHICLGATMDMQLVRYLFGACIDASRILGIDADLRTELAAKRERLAPSRVGSDGRLMEWLEEYPDVDPHHRHVAHMWGVYPGQEISPQATPELAAAARRTLEARGDSGTGWGVAFKATAWIRLGDGDRAHRLLTNLLKPTEGKIGGTYPNLFDAHPPFQIDGNFGGTAAIAEMLLQSRVTEIRGDGFATEILLLPALPRAWPEGSVSGLRARGGFEIALAWSGGRLTGTTVRSVGGRTATIRLGDRSVDLRLEPGSAARFDGALNRL